MKSIILSIKREIIKSKKDFQNVDDYIEYLWNFYNRKYFEGKLKKPILKWLKQSKDNNKVKQYGVWKPGKRILALSKILLANEKVLRDTLIHEMCHQAVSEIDKEVSHIKYDRDYAGGHGPKWKNWMQKCGLDSNRYVDIDAQDALLPEDKRKEVLGIRNKIKEEKEKRGNVEDTQVGENCVAFDPNGNLILAKIAFRTKKGFLYIIPISNTNSYYENVKPSIVYNTNEDEDKEINKIITNDIVNRRYEYIKNKLEFSKNIRSFKNRVEADIYEGEYVFFKVKSSFYFGRIIGFTSIDDEGRSTIVCFSVNDFENMERKKPKLKKAEIDNNLIYNCTKFEANKISMIISNQLVDKYSRAYNKKREQEWNN